MSRKRRTYIADFKIHMVQPYENGNSRADLIREYDLTSSALDKWIKQKQNSGSSLEKDNRKPEENELIQLCKENQHKLMDNDIASSADHGTKVVVIRSNAQILSIINL